MTTEINLAWSLLNKGDYNDNTTDTTRRTTRHVYQRDERFEPILDILVPYPDMLLRGFQIESLVQLIRKSDLAERLREFDQVNTYSSPLTLPQPGNVVSAGLPAGLRIQFRDSLSSFQDAKEGRFIANCTVDPNTGSFVSQYGATSFTVNNNLSSLITVRPGFDLRFQGPIGVAPFQFDIEYIANPRIDWVALLAQVDGKRYSWDDADLRDIYLNDPLWVNRLAALTMSVVEGSYKWQKNDSSAQT
jgi:hypothetical protein